MVAPAGTTTHWLAPITLPSASTSTRALRSTSKPLAEKRWIDVTADTRKSLSVALSAIVERCGPVERYGLVVAECCRPRRKPRDSRKPRGHFDPQGFDLLTSQFLDSDAA